MRQARATRYRYENKAKTSTMDVVTLEGDRGRYLMSYETFMALFQLNINPGCEMTFTVQAHAIPESQSVVPR